MYFTCGVQIIISDIAPIRGLRAKASISLTGIGVAKWLSPPVLWKRFTPALLGTWVPYPHGLSAWPSLRVSPVLWKRLTPALLGSWAPYPYGLTPALFLYQLPCWLLDQRCKSEARTRPVFPLTLTAVLNFRFHFLNSFSFRVP